MPLIDPSLVPSVVPGHLFAYLTQTNTVSVRWITPTDPVFYEAVNRPIADVTLRQLIVAKAVDNLQVRLGHQATFPFVVQPTVTSGSAQADVPLDLIWDIHASLPKKWENLRLAKIKRLSGHNGSTEGYSGFLRLIFTANVQNSTVEASVLYADYQIDSSLTFQISRLLPVTSVEEANAIPSSEAETVAGFITFNTLDQTRADVVDFLEIVAPPAVPVDNNSDGFFDNPTSYEISDSPVGGLSVTGDFNLLSMAHGTGLLTDSAWNAIPLLNSDVQSWINTFNYPFDSEANRVSVDGITIPSGLFKEFVITAPGGDQSTGDNSGLTFPVWVSRIERIGTGTSQVRFYFSTFNVASPSTAPVEFATLDLLRSYTSDEVVEIAPLTDLYLKGSANWMQGFGAGHVVLSTLWDKFTSEVDNFFNAFGSIIHTPPDTVYSHSSTRISSFGVNRVPKYVPTVGQNAALRGSSSRLVIPIDPSSTNLYVTEAHQGIGDQIDLEAQAGITPDVAIDRYGYTGGLARRTIKLVIDSTKVDNSNNNYYTSIILPRLRILLGRDPVFGDEWFNGTRFVKFTGDSWVG